LPFEQRSVQRTRAEDLTQLARAFRRVCRRAARTAFR
jgi:hypothetical protein